MQTTDLVRYPRAGHVTLCFFFKINFFSFYLTFKKYIFVIFFGKKKKKTDIIMRNVRLTTFLP